MTPPAAREVGCRPAEPADLAAVAELFLAARTAAVPDMPPVPQGARRAVREDITGWDLGRRETWLAEADGELVGFATVAGDWLEALYVAPAAQRSGVGSLLLEVVRSLRPRGFCLWVFARNAPARAFYSHHGLVELERTDGSGNSEGEPDVRVVWAGREPLRFLRELIDDVDDELGELLARRTALTRAVQAHKVDLSRDAAREAEVARRVAARAEVLDDEQVARIMDAVISAGLASGRR